MELRRDGESGQTEISLPRCKRSLHVTAVFSGGYASASAASNKYRLARKEKGIETSQNY